MLGGAPPREVCTLNPPIVRLSITRTASTPPVFAAAFDTDRFARQASKTVVGEPVHRGNLRSIDTTTRFEVVSTPSIPDIAEGEWAVCLSLVRAGTRLESILAGLEELAVETAKCTLGPNQRIQLFIVIIPNWVDRLATAPEHESWWLESVRVVAR